MSTQKVNLPHYLPPLKKSCPPERKQSQPCPENCSNIVYADNEKICQDDAEVIGYVGEGMDKGPEWRAFNQEQRSWRSRIGAPLTQTIHDKGLSTVIDWHDRDFYGKRLGPEQKAQVYRLRKWQKRIRVSDATERNLAFALAEISKIANSLNLSPNILETASVIYRKALKGKTVEVVDKKTKQKNKKRTSFVRGRSIQGVTAGAVYVACRQCGLSRTLDEIAQASNMNKKEVGRSYRFLIKELDYSIPPLKSNQFITKFSNQLTMQGKAEEIAHRILNKARELRLTAGRSPTGIAAAATYVASQLTGERKNQREIAEIAQVTEVTIRNRYKELMKKLMFEITI